VGPGDFSQVEVSSGVDLLESIVEDMSNSSSFSSPQI